jgi:hypothetical protein
MIPAGIKDIAIENIKAAIMPSAVFYLFLTLCATGNGALYTWIWRSLFPEALRMRA